MTLVDTNLSDETCGFRDPCTSDSATAGESGVTVEPITIEEIMPYFDEEFVDDDPVIQQAILNNRKRAFQVRVNQINKILPELVKLWDAPSPLHYYLAFLKKNMNPDELLLTIEDVDFQKEINIEAKERVSASRRPRTRNSRKQLQKEIAKKTLEKAREKKEQEFEEDESSDDDEYRGRYTTESSRGSNKDKKQKYKIKCNYPKPSEIKQEEWDSWSDAHKNSYMQMKSNPNTYLYRNLPPGEQQRNGPWSPEEHRLFLKRLHEIRSQGIYEGKWGIFSQSIPGRVGYQCANYYRKLVSTGQVHDEYYSKDEEGKLHFKDRKSYHKSSFNKENGSDNSDSESEDSAPETKVFGFYEKMAQKNPIKNMPDFITGETIEVPAISPDGTILDYKTWLNLLTTTKQDPFTLRKINKRLITIVTTENYDEYKDKVKAYWAKLK